MECLLPYLSMLTVPHIMIELERMLDYRGVRLEGFHCIIIILWRMGSFVTGIKHTWLSLIGLCQLQEGICINRYLCSDPSHGHPRGCGDQEQILTFLLVTTRAIAHPGGCHASEYELISWIWILSRLW